MNGINNATGACGADQFKILPDNILTQELMKICNGYIHNTNHLTDTDEKRCACSRETVQFISQTSCPDQLQYTSWQDLTKRFAWQKHILIHLQTLYRV